MATAGCAPTNKPRTVPHAGGALFVDDGGRGGLPVVFIHGNGGSSAQWRAQLDRLRASGHRATAIDLPGFGRSVAPPSGDYSLDAMASALEAATRQVGLERFVIVGHSYGGAVVAKYAAAHPQKVAGVVFVDAAAVPLPLSPEQLTQLSAAIRANKMRIVQMMFGPMLKPSSASVQEAVMSSAERTSTDAFVGALASLTAYDPKSLFTAYSGPRLAIVASDLESPISFQKQFPEIEAVRLAGAGHWLMLDRPAEVSEAIRRFVAGVR
jgi:pimeloyl-ACP methyl ester carboxylesterase